MDRPMDGRSPGLTNQRRRQGRKSKTPPLICLKKIREKHLSPSSQI
tara:strand:+ start:217 stop:354 length:138 start_codon:yes stop_codon:yes gene_type:complete